MDKEKMADFLNKIVIAKNSIKRIFWKKKIRVGFYVIYTSAFPARPLINEMLKALNVDIEVVVIAAPDVLRGKENAKDQVESVVKEFENNELIEVLSAYDAENDVYLDHSDGLDYACIVNPYESMTHEYCRNEYLAGKGIKTFYIHYSYSVTNFDKNIFKMEEFSKFWKVFLSNPITLEELRLDGCKVDNFKVVGYPKVDHLKAIDDADHQRKIVILAPHHTFKYDELNLSAFEKFVDIYWMLPERYPGVDFVFRPHPLWRINLKNALNWSDVKIEEYLNKILNNKNVSMSHEGDYIDLFNKSSALIHDCGSFLAEYLYTEKPCCFLMRNTDVYRILNLVGKKSLDLHDHAYEVDQVFEFVEKVLSENYGGLNVERSKIINDCVKIYHEKSASKILEEIIGRC